MSASTSTAATPPSSAAWIHPGLAASPSTTVNGNTAGHAHQIPGKLRTVMLAGIAIISLLVGGIGVMNIMLVSVTERTREIGLRKALGGRPQLIRRQFLVEALILGLAGGILGVALGIIGAEVLPHFTDSQVLVSIPACLAAIAMAMAIGVGFGVFPATRAAKLTPIDALRNE